MKIFILLLLISKSFALEGLQYPNTTTDEGKYKSTDAIGLGKYDRINVMDQRTIDLQQELGKLKSETQGRLSNQSQDLSIIKENQKKIQATLKSFEQRLESIEKRVYGEGESSKALE